MTEIPPKRRQNGDAKQVLIGNAVLIVRNDHAGAFLFTLTISQNLEITAFRIK